MTRHLFAVFNRLFRTPKYRRLPESARLTLFHVWALAGDQDPEATWTDAGELAEYLQFYERPAADVDALLEAGFLEELDDGRLGVWDWDEHQVAADKASGRAFEASRKREWRRKTRETEKREKRERSGTRPGHVPDRADGSRSRRENGTPPPSSRRTNGKLEHISSVPLEHLPAYEDALAVGATSNAAEGTAVSVISEGDA